LEDKSAVHRKRVQLLHLSKAFENQVINSKSGQTNSLGIKRALNRNDLGEKWFPQQSLSITAKKNFDK
jgi:hypothetical protein